MNIIYDALFYLIQAIHTLLDNIGLEGSYGLAIILLTVGIRLVLWPLNTAQTRSMKKMQELQPKLKALQDKHKDNPAKMQQELMAFYAEQKFNPFAGCLPMLVQLPIFIGLYGMLVSPNFLAVSGQERFLFIDGLSQTLQSHAGNSNDHTLSVANNDKFVTENTLSVVFNSGSTAQYPIRDTRKVLKITPQPLIPGEPMDVALDGQFIGPEGLPEAFIKRIKTARLVFVNDATKEVETLTLKPSAPVMPKGDEASTDPAAMAWALRDTLPTVEGKTVIHTGILWLIALYGILTVLYQRVMTPAATPGMDGPQAQLMKFMPLMFVGVLFFIPIPAGVLLYLLVTMLMMFIQTLWVKMSDDKAEPTPKPGNQVVDIKAL